MADAHLRLSVDLLGYCLMPHHFHLVLRPRADGDLGRWMQWLLTAHARRYHRHYRTRGHVWQGRFKQFPTMFKNAPLGGTHKRGRTDSIDDTNLLRPDLDALHQGADDLAPILPVRRRQARPDP